jgi:GrpB-like predicted nucleotidyltransferase (UPF0157 family)
VVALARTTDGTRTTRADDLEFTAAHRLERARRVDCTPGRLHPVDARTFPKLGDPVELVAHDPNWARAFDLERDRLVNALGLVESGGVLEWVEHVGSTAIPGIHAKPILDIAAVVHPFPLAESRREALEKLGYEYRGEAVVSGREFFRTDPRTRHLHLFAFNSDAFFQHVTFRDFLRAHRDRAAQYEALKLELADRFRLDREAYTNGKDALVARLNLEARGWQIEQTGFGPVLEAARTLRAYRGEWAISGGWGLDAWAGAPSRTHHDVNVIVWRDELPELERFLLEDGWDAQVVVEAGAHQPWSKITAPLELPVTQIHARKRLGHAHDLVSTRFLDFQISERTGTNWVWRGDSQVTRPLEQSRLTSNRSADGLGVPILAPEIALFFKARTDMRERDELDFGHALARLEPARRDWLRSALVRTLGDHAWLTRL